MPEPRRTGPAIVSDLVYDVGMHDGSDTAYYLRSGYRVVAIDANPALVDAARRRFAAEIADGRLVLVNVGIAEAEGRATFWVGDDHSDWSSFDPAVPGRGGARHHPIEVPVRPLAAIVAEHGMPWYCKIDIEGADHLCLDAFTPEARPAFVSVELDAERPLLERLRGLGFDAFRVVDEACLCAPPVRLYEARRWLPAPSHGALRVATRLVRGRRSDAGWRFPRGSSGPLPDRWGGRWLDHDEAGRLTRRLEGLRRRGLLGIHDWFDLHAADRETLPAAAAPSPPRRRA